MAIDEEVKVVVGSTELSGHLTIPKKPGGVVVFAHGSGSGRHSPRNRLVAGVLNDAGLGTLLFDLLTSIEERDRSNVFDINLGAVTHISSTISPNEPGANAQYQVVFTPHTTLLANVDTITVRFDKDIGIPTSVSKNSVNVRPAWSPLEHGSICR